MKKKRCGVGYEEEEILGMGYEENSDFFNFFFNFNSYLTRMIYFYFIFFVTSILGDKRNSLLNSIWV